MSHLIDARNIFTKVFYNKYSDTFINQYMIFYLRNGKFYLKEEQFMCINLIKVNIKGIYSSLPTIFTIYEDMARKYVLFINYY